GLPRAPRELLEHKRQGNLISHGEPLPAGETELATLDVLVHSIADAVTESLIPAGLVLHEGDSGGLRPSFVWDGDGGA
ncbi:hypothetical protein, partial [Streptomyces sp. GbtcB6]|uniref:hypothetical protein n=1 Tax=Streptomyces sp. GbtcB6 TaxID=2824751 RepID=UPI001C309079